MTAQEFAALLNGREYGHEITKAEEERAHIAGLVVVFGHSDDNVELRGCINDEVGAYDGTTLRITKSGHLLPDWESVNHDDEDEAQEYFRKKFAGVRTIEAVWCPAGDPGLSWAYETTIPHATFLINEDGGPFCRGIVFHLSDVL
jgi:hypothetical protein